MDDYSATPMPRFGFSTMQDAATRLRKAAQGSGEAHLHLLPFNRYDPANSIWWLSPSSDNPANRYGKIGIAGPPWSTPGDLLVGLYVEKGIGETAAPEFGRTPRGQKSVKGPDWLWRRRFIGALRSDAFTEEASRAEQQAGLPLTVMIDAGVVVPKSEGRDEDDRPNLGGDMVRFEYSDRRLTTIDADTPTNLLTSLATADTFAGVGQALDAVPGSDWVWIDFHIGLRFRAADASPGPADWSAEQVWRRACQPWASWLE